MTAAELLLTISEDGTLKLPQAVLDALGTRQVKLSVQDGQMTLRPHSTLLSEIEDPLERERAYQEFVALAMRPGGGPLPSTRAELNDLVYD